MHDAGESRLLRAPRIILMNPEDTAAIALPIIDIFSINLVEDYSVSTDEVKFGVVKKSMASRCPCCHFLVMKTQCSHGTSVVKCSERYQAQWTKREPLRD